MVRVPDVGDPLADISKHIRKPERVGRVLATRIPAPATDFISLLVIKVIRLCRCDALSPRVDTCRAGPGRILPFRLGWKTVSLTSPIAEIHGLTPRNHRYRPIVGQPSLMLLLETAILSDCHRKGSKQKLCDQHGVSWAFRVIREFVMVILAHHK